MKELTVDQIELVSGAGWLTAVKEVGKWLASTAAGEAVIEGAKAVMDATGEAGGYNAGSSCGCSYDNMPPGMQ